MTLPPRCSDGASPGLAGRSSTRFPSPASGEPSAAGGLRAGCLPSPGDPAPQTSEGPRSAQRAPRRRAVCPIVPASFIIGARCPEYIPRCQPWKWRKMGCLAHEKKCSILAPLSANWLQRVLDLCLGSRRMGTQAHRPSRGPGGGGHRPEGPPGTQEDGDTGLKVLPEPRRTGTQAHRPSRALQGLRAPPPLALPGDHRSSCSPQQRGAESSLGLLLPPSSTPQDPAGHTLPCTLFSWSTNPPSPTAPWPRLSLSPCRPVRLSPTTSGARGPPSLRPQQPRCCSAGSSEGVPYGCKQGPRFLLPASKRPERTHALKSEEQKSVNSDS